MSPRQKIENLQTKRATAKAQHAANSLALSADDAARLVNAEADVLGLPHPHEQLSETKRTALIEALAACDRIIEFVDNQLPAAQQDVDNAIASRRRVQSQHICAEIVPALEAQAKEAGAVFGRALASLAAAEDFALRLQGRPGATYAQGNASMLCAAMRSTEARNVFCDVGAGRGAWDWAGYAETSASIEQKIQEISA